LEKQQAPTEIKASLNSKWDFNHYYRSLDTYRFFLHQ